MQEHSNLFTKALEVVGTEAQSGVDWNHFCHENWMFIPLSLEQGLYSNILRKWDLWWFENNFFFFSHENLTFIPLPQENSFFSYFENFFFFFFNYLEKITFWFLSSCYHEKMYHVIFRQNNELVIVTLNNDLKMRVKKNNNNRAALGFHTRV